MFDVFKKKNVLLIKRRSKYDRKSIVIVDGDNDGLIHANAISKEAISETRISKVCFIFPLLIAVSVMIYGIGLGKFVNLLIAALFLIYASIVYFFEYRRKRFILTEKALYIIESESRWVGMDLSKGSIESVSLNKTILGSMFGYCGAYVNVYSNNKEHVIVLNRIVRGDIFFNNVVRQQLKVMGIDKYKEIKFKQLFFNPVGKVVGSGSGKIDKI